MLRIIQRRREWWLPAALALLNVIFFKQVLLPEDGAAALVNTYYAGGDDLRNLFYPMRAFVVESVRNGQFPLWNPYTLGGFTAVGSPQVGLYYPFNWLALLFELCSKQQMHPTYSGAFHPGGRRLRVMISLTSWSFDIHLRIEMHA